MKFNSKLYELANRAKAKDIVRTNVTDEQKEKLGRVLELITEKLEDAVRAREDGQHISDYPISVPFYVNETGHAELTELCHAGLVEPFLAEYGITLHTINNANGKPYAIELIWNYNAYSTASIAAFIAMTGDQQREYCKANGHQWGPIKELDTIDGPKWVQYCMCCHADNIMYIKPPEFVKQTGRLEEEATKTIARGEHPSYSGKKSGQ